MNFGRMCDDERGFTLVEIGIVLGVTGILLTLAVPSLKGWKESISLRNAAATVMNALVTSRIRAIAERRNYTLSVDYTADSYTIAPSGEVGRLSGSADLYVDSSDPDCPPLSVQNVLFRPNSTADAAGFEAVYLRSRSPRVQVRYRVKVLGATAKVGVEVLRGGAWEGAY